MQPDCLLPWQRMIATPWRMLITPAAVWSQLSKQPQWHWALVAHWLLALAGWLITTEAMQEMILATGMPATARINPVANIISTAIILMVGLLSLSFVAAWVTVGAMRIIGCRATLNQALTWLAYAMMPYSIGHLAGRLLFAIVKPLAESPQQALAYILKPFSLGLAGFLPDSFPPLSFGWFAFTYFDAFSLWTIALLISGALFFLRLDSRKTLWLSLELMLLFVAVITGLWNATQYLLLQLAR